MTTGALSRQLAEHLVEAATAAPSMHNAQPWRFVARLTDRVIEIYADPARTLRRGDPQGRAVHLACGAAVFNLRLAAALSGAEPVARLLPSPRDPLLLASVRLAGPYRPRPAEQDLHSAIGRHGGSGQPGHTGPAGHPHYTGYTGQAGYPGHPGHLLPRAVQAALAEAAALEGASLRLLDRPDALRILRPAADAGLAAAPAQSSPCQFAVISTAADDRTAWLRAGQAAQRVLLLAAHHGLAAVPLAPVLELPGPRLRPDPRLGAVRPEIVLRLGGPAGEQPPPYRRPVAQVMRVIAPAGRQDEGPRRVPHPALPPAERELMRSR